MKHTPGPWIDSPYSVGAIISKDREALEKASALEIAYYGGAVIAETVRERDRPAIKAVPAMLAALKAWARMLDLERQAEDDHSVRTAFAAQDARDEAAQLTRAVLAEGGDDVA